MDQPEIYTQEDTVTGKLKELREVFEAFRDSSVRFVQGETVNFREKLNATEENLEELHFKRRRMDYRMTQAETIIRSLDRRVHEQGQIHSGDVRSIREEMRDLQGRIQALEATQRPKPTASSEQAHGGLPGPAVASEGIMRFQDYVRWLLRVLWERDTKKCMEVLRTAWVVAAWDLIKEFSNRVPSLVSMSKACSKWEGSYDRAGCVSNSISTMTFLISSVILLFHLFRAVKAARNRHNEVQ